MDNKSKATGDRISQSEFLRPPAEAKKSRWGFRGKTVWNWLELLIVPIVLALIGFVFTNAQEHAQRLEEQANQLEIEALQAKQALKLEEQRAQNAAVENYYAAIKELLLDEDLNKGRVRLLIQGRTLTVLESLDSSHKTQVVRFLIQANLVQGDPYGREAGPPIIFLDHTDLHGVDLSGADRPGGPPVSARSGPFGGLQNH